MLNSDATAYKLMEQAERFRQGTVDLEKTVVGGFSIDQLLKIAECHAAYLQAAGAFAIAAAIQSLIPQIEAIATKEQE